MRPKSEPKQPQRELFQIDLEQLIDLNHPLVRLGQYIDWDCFAATLGGSYHPTQGAPGNPTRLMVALHFQKLLRAVPRHLVRPIYAIMSRLLSAWSFISSRIIIQAA